MGLLTLISAGALAQTAAGTSAADTVLAGLPGVLIASLALIFAIRERARARQLEQLRPGNETAAFSPVALWQIDRDGRTLYANDAALGLFGASDVDALAAADAGSLLQRDDQESPSDPEQPFRATVHALDRRGQHRVLVFERTVAGDSGELLTVRTLVAPELLSQRRTNDDARTVAA